MLNQFAIGRVPGHRIWSSVDNNGQQATQDGGRSAYDSFVHDNWL
jgi:hypothetical protein